MLKLEGGKRLKKDSNNLNTIQSKKMPVVSIITIVYNGAKHIETTIQSVINQTYHKIGKIEYIIIDGGSTDGTIDIIKKYEDYIDYWVSEKDKGISDAMNKGIEYATGEIIGMIHSDDWYELDTVENAVKLFVNTGCDIVCASICYYKDEKPYFVDKSNPNDLFLKMSIWHPTTFVKSDVYKKIGKFNLNYKSGMDYDFLLRCKINNLKFVVDNKVYANMRAGGVSDQDWRLMLNEEIKIKLTNGIKKSEVYLFYFKRYLFFLFTTSLKKILTFLKLDFIINMYKKLRNKFDKRFVN